MNLKYELKSIVPNDKTLALVTSRSKNGRSRHFVTSFRFNNKAISIAYKTQKFNKKKIKWADKNQKSKKHSKYINSNQFLECKLQCCHIKLF